MDFDAIRAGEKPKEEVMKDLKGIATKARTQITKDYIAWPLLSGLVMTALDLATTSGEKPRRFGLSRRSQGSRLQQLVARRSFREPYRRTFWANFSANIVRNVWSHAIIFCGHFPDQTYTFSKAETEDESTGARYVRQLIGAANIDGGPLFHVMSGNLSYQVEHHLYPDMPSTRYGEIAPRVREICERYELPYNTGPFSQQWGMVMRTIARLALPGGKPRAKPGPYKGDKVRNKGERADAVAA
jgi:hypothetical protein